MAVEVKFCGLMREADAEAGARAGARYLGVIFAESPRRLEPEAARAVFEAGARGRSKAGARRVGVFGASRTVDVARIAAAAELDIVQLHGDPTIADVAALRSEFGGEIWAVLRIDGSELPEHSAELAGGADALVVDAKVAGSLGGTGRTLDWRGLAEPLARLRSEARLVLAGGLTPHNVAAAIQVLRPDIVDVSSGVETAPGVKDHARMRAFAAAAGVLPKE